MVTEVTEPSTRSTNDPAHPDNPNTDHTNKDGEKPTTAIDAILDTEFIPTLDDAPVVQKAKSHFLLLSLLVGAVFAAWFSGFEVRIHITFLPPFLFPRSPPKYPREHRLSQFLKEASDT